MAHGCLGPFFGKFHNELEDDEYADDDRPGAARQERSAEEAKSRRSFFSRTPIAPRSLGAGESARTGDFALKRHIKESSECRTSGRRKAPKAALEAATRRSRRWNACAWSTSPNGSCRSL
ncbi:unnamed protein product [Prorocentrum cordatum]|uniref:Uncharacterized protein n=1 Tax=Prorocentrum cordatum TaxID=2364126 RepID=A0ABN9SQ62_9DINO|nr:unnamed protein product [Polarella glacialis]